MRAFVFFDGDLKGGAGSFFFFFFERPPKKGGAGGLRGEGAGPEKLTINFMGPNFDVVFRATLYKPYSLMS